MLFGAADKYNYPDDIFDDTRMSFGDHLDELRTRLRLALFGPIIFTVLGLLLDGIGLMINQPKFGIGRPMLGVITDPVKVMVRDFYDRRNQKLEGKLPGMDENDPAVVDAVRKKFAEKGITALNDAEMKVLKGIMIEMPIVVPVEAFTPAFGPPKDPDITEIKAKIKVSPAHLNFLANMGDTINDNKSYLTALSAQEGMVVYFKVTLLCAVVLSCPWSFYHLWAFVAAGLYPHEKKYVHKFLPATVILFLSGVFLCQFVVLPGTVRALLAFNEYINVDPDLRLNEWLSFAIIMPLVFGVSFQTPLVMFVLNRVGIFTAQAYWSKWRMAMFVLAVFSAVITPSPDAVTMLYLFVPMFGLYLLGVAVCYFYPPAPLEPDEDDASEVAV